MARVVFDASAVIALLLEEVEEIGCVLIRRGRLEMRGLAPPKHGHDLRDLL